MAYRVSRRGRIESQRKALVFVAHADDEAIGSGGLIVFLVARQWAVRVCVMSVGDCRQLVTGHTEAKQRLRELKGSERIGGFEAKLLFGSKEFMRLDTMPRKRLCDCIEDEIENFRPEVVVIPPISSYDQDHKATAEAAMTALRPRPTSLRHFVPTVLECDEPYWWRLTEPRPSPNLFVPLTRTELGKKLRMVRAYRTQDRPDPFGRSTENLRRCAETFGVEIGGGYAEAYRILRSCGHGLF